MSALRFIEPEENGPRGWKPSGQKAKQKDALHSAESQALGAAEAAKKGAIDGAWRGVYFYGDAPAPVETVTKTPTGIVRRVVRAAAGLMGAGGAPVVEFAAQFKSSAAGFTGVIIETVAVNGRPMTISSAVAGTFDAKGGVRFTKKYDGTEGHSHSVDYQGALSADGKRIEGTWKLPSGGGGFVMKR